MNLQDQIKALELNALATRKVAEDQLRELEELKAKSKRPAPTVRRNLKDARVQRFAEFYFKKKLVKTTKI